MKCKVILPVLVRRSGMGKLLLYSMSDSSGVASPSISRFEGPYLHCPLPSSIGMVLRFDGGEKGVEEG